MSKILIGLFAAFLGLFVIAGIVYAIANVKRKDNGLPLRISYWSSYRLVGVLFVIALCLEPVSDPSNVYVATSNATDPVYHCTWCGKEYSGTGYFHVENISYTIIYFSYKIHSCCR